jgi:hypothetical protein
MKTTTGGVMTTPAYDGKTPHVFLALTEWSPNGEFMQSGALSIAEVDRLIDDLIDAQRIAHLMASGSKQ